MSLKFYCDISSALFFAKNDKYMKGAKSIELIYFVAKKHVQKHKVSNSDISTKIMFVDPLTKGLLPKAFIEHVEKLGLTDSNV